MSNDPRIYMSSAIAQHQVLSSMLLDTGDEPFGPPAGESITGRQALERRDRLAQAYLRGTTEVTREDVRDAFEHALELNKVEQALNACGVCGPVAEGILAKYDAMWSTSGYNHDEELSDFLMDTAVPKPE